MAHVMTHDSWLATHVWATEVAPLVQCFQELRPLQAPRGISIVSVFRHGRTRFRYRRQDRLVLKQKQKQKRRGAVGWVCADG